MRKFDCHSSVYKQTVLTGNMSRAAAFAFIGLLAAGILPGSGVKAAAAPTLTVRSAGGIAHIMPTVAGAEALRAAILKQSAAATLLYHGGPVIQPGPTIFEIFWIPPHLQTGAPTGVSAKYKTVLENYASNLPAHGLLNIVTQYFQNSTSPKYIQNAGRLARVFTDTSAYPASGCSDPATPGNCISDAQIRAEIQKIITANGVTPSINDIFLLFTSSGEGSCFGSSCAYTQFCAYHSFFTGTGGHLVVYGNEPYANTSVCKAPGQTEPNGDVGDLSASVASHEVTEATTDPELNAWFDSSGNEIGDLCNFVFGTNTWTGPSAAANQMWNGFFFELQQEYDNNSAACESAGPQ